jgi:hypothetical protein
MSSAKPAGKTFSENNTVLNDSYSFLNVYIRCMDVWKKINVRTQANRQLLFLIIQACSFQPQR